MRALAALVFAITWPAALAEMFSPQDTNNGSAPGDGILETVIGGEWVVEPGDNITYADVVIALNSGLRILPGGRLNLHNVSLIANMSGVGVSVSSNGTLEISDSLVDAGPWSGGAAEGLWQFTFRVDPGGVLDARRTTFGHIGKPIANLWDAGLYVGSPSVTLDEVVVRSGQNRLVLDNAAGVVARNVTFADSVESDLLLAGDSTLVFVGGAFNATNISAASHVNVSYFLDLAMLDSTGRPVPGMEYAVSSLGTRIHRTARFGGSEQRTAVDLQGRHAPRWLEVPAAVLEGDLPPVPFPTTVEASYAEWSENRTAVLSNNTALTFVKQLSNSRALLEATPPVLADPGHVLSPFAVGPGAAWADFDWDGDEDLYATGGATANSGPPDPDGMQVRAPNHLFRNDGGLGFTDVTAAAGVSYRGSAGVSFADFDNDGFPDLYLLNYGWGGSLTSPGEANVLFHNNGDGTFSNVTASAAVGGAAHSTAAAWADFDADGNLDLYVLNRGVLLNGSNRTEPNILYRNEGDGTFSDVTSAAGLAGPGLSTSALWFDYDNDGHIDLLVGCMDGVSPLYRNNGDGSFSDMTSSAGLASPGSTLAFDARDLDGNGWLDVFAADADADRLWMNYGGYFVDQAAARGVASVLAGTATFFEDIEMDGDFDLFVANGLAEGQKDFGGLQLFRNEGAGFFSDVTAEAGLDLSASRFASAAVTRGTLGVREIFLTSAQGPNALLVAGSVPPFPTEPIALRGTVSNREAIGATVHVYTTDGFHNWMQVVGGPPSTSQNPYQAIFGLGTHSSVENVTVIWPSGSVQVFEGEAARFTFTEPADVEISAGGNRTVDEDAAVIFDAEVVRADDREFARHATYSWYLNSSNDSVLLAGENVSFIFQDFGIWNVLLTAYDPTTSLAVQTTAVITVRDATAPKARVIAPTADFRLEGGGATLLLQGSAADNDPSFDSTGVFMWEVVGEGWNSTATGKVATVVVLAEGNITVRLTVADAAGNTAVADVQGRAGVPPPHGDPPGPGLLVLVSLGLIGVAVGVAGVVAIQRFYLRPPQKPPET